MQLAPGWPIEKVESAVNSYSKTDLHKFIDVRYQSLFFEPLSLLDQQSSDKKSAHPSAKGQNVEYWRFGFAITSLCCLLIETFQCYRAGLPSSHKGELRHLHEEFHSLLAIHPEYVIPDSEWPNDVGEVFRCFFTQNQSLFPGIIGGDFYRNVRNGLLHQAQTKKGWRIGISPDLVAGKKLSRVRLLQQLRTYFDNYLSELGRNQRDISIGDNARRKIW